MGKMVAQWHTQCNLRLLHRCVGICFVYSSAGEGSARVPGRDEFWYEEELRQKALAGSTATTRVRFFWGTDIHGKPQVYGVHTGEGTPYENVRVANMQWNEQTQRYEFTPLTMSMAPDYLDAGKSGTWVCSGPYR